MTIFNPHYEGINQMTNQNLYRKARKRAATYNDALGSIASAADVIGVHERTLSDYENYITRPPVETVVRMADIYNAPELLANYCALECPIGKVRGMREIEDKTAAENVLELLQLLQESARVQTTLINIGVSPMLSKDQKEQLDKVVEWINNIHQKGENLKCKTSM